jgi:hypothetical protein
MLTVFKIQCFTVTFHQRWQLDCTQYYCEEEEARFFSTTVALCYEYTCSTHSNDLLRCKVMLQIILITRLLSHCPQQKGICSGKFSSTCQLVAIWDFAGKLQRDFAGKYPVPNVTFSNLAVSVVPSGTFRVNIQCPTERLLTKLFKLLSIQQPKPQRWVGKLHSVQVLEVDEVQAVIFQQPRPLQWVGKLQAWVVTARQICGLVQWACVNSNCPTPYSNLQHLTYGACRCDRGASILSVTCSTWYPVLL